MEVFLMKRFFHTKVPALILALVLMLSAVPTAGAALVWNTSSDPTCSHSSYTILGSKDPTCQATGWRILKCNSCGTSGIETLSTTSHVYRTYSYDSTYHWLACSNCGTVDSSSKSRHDDSNRDGRCDVCSYSMGTGSGEDITYEVRPGSYVYFDEDDFYDMVKKAYPGYTLDYVIFDRPNSSVFSDGTLYYNYGGRDEMSLSASDLSNGTFYYDGSYDERNEEYDLDELAFVADKSFKDEIKLSFRAYCNSSRYVDGAVIISSTESSSVTAKSDLSYTVQAGGKVYLDERDFYDFFDDNTSSGSLDYVVFDRPDSDAFDHGTLYYNYGGKNEVTLTRNSLSSGTFYYRGSYDEDHEEYDLDDLTFVADKSFKDDVKLTFRAYSSSGKYVEGSLVFTSGKSSKTTITYEVSAGDKVYIDQDDFYDFYKDNGPSGSLKYVVFDRPSSSTFSDSTLYYDYGGRNEDSFSYSSLARATFYYNGTYDEDNDYYDLDDLTFVADKTFKDDVKLTFRAYYSSSKYVDGTLVFTTGKSSTSTITYEVAAGNKVYIDQDDFYDFYNKNGPSGSLKYVIFDRPSSSTFSDSTLYYDYGGRNEDSFSYSSLARATFFYNGTYDEDNDYYDLDDLTFVADKTFKDDVKLTFRAYYSSSKYVDGTLVFTAGKSSASTTVSGDIRYAATYGSNLQINANDIARYFSNSYPGYTLQYVTLGGVPSTGSLYYNYYGASQYGTSTSLRLTSSNYNSQVLYFSPVSTAQYALTELTYVPSGNNYCVTIPFTAYGSGSRSLNGTILISVNSSAVSEVYGVTQRGNAVTFPASAIYSAVSTSTGISLGSIQLLSLPAASQGTVYVGTGSTRATTNTLYTYASGTQQISQLRFVPTSTFTGSVQIPYVAYNTSGTPIATGLFSLGVLSSAKNFKDVSTSTWCYKYVVELSDAKVIDGYSDGSFKPNSTITYGAALKLIMLAAGYPEQPAVSSNVFSGYLAKAQSEGIITRSDVDLTKPITRLQVAQIAAGAMKLNTSNLSSVQPFTDTTDASVRALNAAGIVEGYFSNGTSTYRPNNTLTRGQVSAIVWRMEQYNK